MVPDRGDGFEVDDLDGLDNENVQPVLGLKLNWSMMSSVLSRNEVDAKF